MKKNILKATLVAAFVLIAGFNVYNAQKSDVMSDLALANVKALAGGEFYSSKEGDGHGYGIQNMERVVKSYNGKMEYNVDPEWVTVDIFLQQKDEI